MKDLSIQEHLDIICRGAVDVIDERGLRERLELARKECRGLRIKFGMDPSSADLHVGHAVHLVKLRALQDLGHTVILLVGDSTAMVGDPSGRNKLRPQLTREQVEANMATYTTQAGVILDMERLELRYNSEWFERMGFQDILKLAGRMTVAQMMQRDMFQKRVAEDQPIGIHEFLYPLMQGWDSVELACDLEMGGTDQLFNLLVGRDFQGQVGQKPQLVLTMPLISGVDGRKMSKSYGNAIGLTDAPKDVFGKTMRLGDGDMGLWYELLTSLGADELSELLAGHPREAKARLGQELTSLLHGPQAAQAAREAFDKQFVKKELPDDIPQRSLGTNWPAEGLPLFVLLREAGFAKSGSEARRLITQGGVRCDGEVQREPTAMIEPPENELLLQAGKRRFVRLSQ